MNTETAKQTSLDLRKQFIKLLQKYNGDSLRVRNELGVTRQWIYHWKKNDESFREDFKKFTNVTLVNQHSAITSLGDVKICCKVSSGALDKSITVDLSLFKEPNMEKDDIEKVFKDVLGKGSTFSFVLFQNDTEIKTITWSQEQLYILARLIIAVGDEGF